MNRIIELSSGGNISVVARRCFQRCFNINGNKHGRPVSIGQGCPQITAGLCKDMQVCDNLDVGILPRSATIDAYLWTGPDTLLRHSQVENCPSIGPVGIPAMCMFLRPQRSQYPLTRGPDPGWRIAWRCRNGRYRSQLVT